MLTRVSRNAESPFRSTREDRREMLIAHFLGAIEPLLEDTSYADMSVERIIREGRIGRTTFYAYFNDKSDLLLAMGRHVVEDLREIAFWKLPHDATYADLRTAVAKLVDVYRTHRLLLRSIVEGSSYDAGLRSVYGSAVAAGVDNVAKHIEEGQRRGSIEAELSVRGTARLLVHMAASSLHDVIGVEGDPDESGEFLESLTMLIWRILYAGVRPAPGAS